MVRASRGPGGSGRRSGRGEPARYGFRCANLEAKQGQALESTRVGGVGGPGLILRRLTPHPRHPALLQRQVDALHQVLYLLDGRFPELLVGEQRLFVR